MSDIVQSSVKKGTTRFTPKILARPGQLSQTPTPPSPADSPSQLPLNELREQQQLQSLLAESTPISISAFIDSSPSSNSSIKENLNVENSNISIDVIPVSRQKVATVLLPLVSKNKNAFGDTTNKVLRPRLREKSKAPPVENGVTTGKRRIEKRSSAVVLEKVDMHNEVVRTAQPMRLFCSDSATVDGQSTKYTALAHLQRAREDSIRRSRQHRIKDRQKQLSQLGDDEVAKAEFRLAWHAKEQGLREQESRVMTANLTVTETHTQPALTQVASSQLANKLQKNGNEDEADMMHLDSEGDENDETASMADDNSGGPQVRFINGEFVVDETSLSIRELPQKSHATENMAVIEEISNRYFNQTTFMKKKNRTLHWQPDEVELFYKGLSAWGLNFELISRMIPGKTRINVRNKYNRECKRSGNRVAAAMRNKITMRLSDFSVASGIPLAEFSKPFPADVVLAFGSVPHTQTSLSKNNEADTGQKNVGEEGDNEDDGEVMQVSDEDDSNPGEDGKTVLSLDTASIHQKEAVFEPQEIEDEELMTLSADED